MPGPPSSSSSGTSTRAARPVGDVPRPYDEPGEGLEEAAVEPQRGDQDRHARGQHGERHGRREPAAQGLELLQRLGQAQDETSAARTGERVGGVDVGVARRAAPADGHPGPGQGGPHLRPVAWFSIRADPLRLDALSASTLPSLAIRVRRSAAVRGESAEPGPRVGPPDRRPLAARSE